MCTWNLALMALVNSVTEVTSELQLSDEERMFMQTYKAGMYAAFLHDQKVLFSYRSSQLSMGRLNGTFATFNELAVQLMTSLSSLSSLSSLYLFT